MLDTIHNINTYSSPSGAYTIINICIVAINALVAVFVNFILFNRRKIADRKHQNESILYTNLVVANIKSILLYFAEEQKFVFDLFDTQRHGIGEVILIKRVETACDLIEKKFDDYEINISPHLTCYSKIYSDNISKLCDEYQSKCTELATKYCGDDFDRDSLLYELTQSKKTILVKIFDIIRAATPT